MISLCVWPDFERVIGHHIQHENYRGALEVLTKQTDVELYYRFSPLLMQYVPKETVEAWVKQGRHLEPKKLIPALVQYDHMRNREQVLIILPVLWKVYTLILLGVIYVFFPLLPLILLSFYLSFSNSSLPLYCHHQMKGDMCTYNEAENSYCPSFGAAVYSASPSPSNQSVLYLAVFSFF